MSTVKLLVDTLINITANTVRHPKCLGYYDEYTGDYDCDYSSVLICEDCKYGCGRKDPEAKCNEAVE